MRSVLNIISLLTLVTGTVTQICEYEKSVVLTNRTYHGILYEDGEYFVDNITGEERGCVCMKEICYRKCCPLGQGWNSVAKKCAALQDEFNAVVNPGSKSTKQLHALFGGVLKCSEENENLLQLPEAFGLLEMDGKFNVSVDDVEYTLYNLDKYCIDNFFKENKKTKNKTVTRKAFVCFKKAEEMKPSITNAICMLVSCVFILLTVVIYAFLPELRTLHGMVMTTYLLSFFMGFLILATMQLLLVNRDITIIGCTIMTFVIYFFILAAFFWQNVMCYDLWATFRGITANGVTNSNRRKFLSYCSYAFGMPTVLTGMLAGLEFSGLEDTYNLLPGLRKQGCFLYKKSKLIYLYAPIIVLCIANLVLFALTARNIANTVHETEVLRRKDKHRFWLYIKLFVVTGLTWIFEVIGYLLPQVEYLWIFTDIYNTLIGVLIFIIFICKRKIFKSVKKRYNHLLNKQLSKSRTSATTSSFLSPSRGGSDKNKK